MDDPPMTFAAKIRLLDRPLPGSGLSGAAAKAPWLAVIAPAPRPALKEAF
ncbi:hypothetical protein ACXN5S_12015 [Pseudoroseicyclus sp. H15]